MSKIIWPVKPLVSLTSRIGDGIHGTPKYTGGQGYPFINGNNLSSGSIVITDSTKNVSREEYEKYFIDFDANTLFLSINGTLGNVAIYKGEKIILGKSAAYIKCVDINVSYLYYYLQLEEVQTQLWNIATGSTIKNLSLASIRSLEVPTPPTNISINIANVLSTLDKKIELNNQINAELEAMAKTLYDYWFVQFDFPNADGKPYKSSGGKMVYNEVLKREIPEGWQQATLWDIAKYYNGLAMQKYRPTGDEYLPVIKIREMNNGISPDTEKARIDIPSAAIIDDGDLLFSWSATLDVKIWSQGKGALNQHIFKVTSDDYPQSFYYFELMNYLSHFKMMAEMRKTTMGHITLEHLKQANIVLPPINLIKKLDEKLKPIFEHSLVLKKENNSLVELRDWLLPMLMNGQMTVK